MDNLKKFYAKIMRDDALAAKFEKILDETEIELEGENHLPQLAELSQKIYELSKEVGVEITVDDLKRYIERNYENAEDTEKMSDVELEMVAGGAKHFRPRLRGCFTADSKVSTPSGDKVISDIKVGDEVFSVDAQNNKVVSKVTEVRPTVNEEIYKVEFSNGATWFTTSSQWFYCGNDDYACAIDSQGKAALTEVGATATVANVTKTGEVQKVYDFIVGGVNVFFVGGIAAEGYSVD